MGNVFVAYVIFQVFQVISSALMEKKAYRLFWNPLEGRRGVSGAPTFR